MADIKTANNGVSHQNSVQGQLTGNGQSTWLTPVRKAAHHQQLTAHRERLTGKLLTGKLHRERLTANGSQLLADSRERTAEKKRDCPIGTIPLYLARINRTSPGYRISATCTVRSRFHSCAQRMVW